MPFSLANSSIFRRLSILVIAVSRIVSSMCLLEWSCAGGPVGVVLAQAPFPCPMRAVLKYALLWIISCAFRQVLWPFFLLPGMVIFIQALLLAGCHVRLYS